MPTRGAIALPRCSRLHISQKYMKIINASPIPYISSPTEGICNQSGKKKMTSGERGCKLLMLRLGTFCNLRDFRWEFSAMCKFRDDQASVSLNSTLERWSTIQFSFYFLSWISIYVNFVVVESNNGWAMVLRLIS